MSLSWSSSRDVFPILNGLYFGGKEIHLGILYHGLILLLYIYIYGFGLSLSLKVGSWYVDR